MLVTAFRPHSCGMVYITVIKCHTLYSAGIAEFFSEALQCIDHDLHTIYIILPHNTVVNTMITIVIKSSVDESL